VSNARKRARWRLEYALLYGLFAVARLLPVRWRATCGRSLGLCAWRFFHIRRDVVLQNLLASFPSEMGEAGVQGLARQVFAHLGVTLMEFIAFTRIGPEQICDLVTIEGREHLEECRSKRRGAIFTSGHLGNWELAGAALAAYGYTTSFLIKNQSNPYIDRLQNEIRRRAGIGIIRQGASVRHLVYALRRGEFVGMLADQDAGNDGLFVNFLGRTASVFRGPAYLAFRTGCPILPAAILRQDDGRHRLVFTPPLEVDPSWDEETAIRELTRHHTARLEAFIRGHPEQYFWVHRRWKTQPPDRSV